ncbi:MAG: DUF402 domain-containing protein [Lachnospiraceae bacterium]|nr:DUF402 domain-containing protein [Lachnospiraceae bacterium]
MDNKNIKLFRKRIIPPECIPLKDDEILFIDDKIIVTRWNTLKPKTDLHHGLSCYFLNEGYKVSKFMKKDGSLLYWYCDIVEHVFDPEDDSYLFTDLLADVVIYPDNSVRVIDVDEVADAISVGSITKEQCIRLLRSLDSLLNIIYNGHFKDLTGIIEKYSSNDQ